MSELVAAIHELTQLRMTPSPPTVDRRCLNSLNKVETTSHHCAQGVHLQHVVVVLKDWVTETKDTLWVSNSSTSLAKSASDRVRRSTL